ncbi:unnamed protein product [Cunninghamella blakesleeana]
MDKDNTLPKLIPPLPASSPATAVVTETSKPILYTPYPPLPVPTGPVIHETQVTEKPEIEYDPLSRAGISPKPRLVVLTGVGGFGIWYRSYFRWKTISFTIFS